MEDWTTGVARDVMPPPAVRTRIVDELRRAGYIRRPRSWQWRAAAAILLFAAGWFTHASLRSAGEQGPRFMLLLYGAPAAAADESARVAEYRDWAIAIRAQGRHVSGERLDGIPTSVGADISAVPNGFFIVEAQSLEEARAMASSHPHVRYGGSIAIRAIGGS